MPTFTDSTCLRPSAHSAGEVAGLLIKFKNGGSIDDTRCIWDLLAERKVIIPVEFTNDVDWIQSMCHIHSGLMFKVSYKDGVDPDKSCIWDLVKEKKVRLPSQQADNADWVTANCQVHINDYQPSATMDDYYYLHCEVCRHQSSTKDVWVKHLNSIEHTTKFEPGGGYSDDMTEPDCLWPNGFETTRRYDCIGREFVIPRFDYTLTFNCPEHDTHP